MLPSLLSLLSSRLAARSRRGLLLSGLALGPLPAALAQGGLAPTVYSVGTHPLGVALGDVNADGRLDMVVANQDGNNVSVLLNLAATPGTYGPAVSYPAGGTGCTGVALGDMNSDGRPDIVTANQTSGTVSVLLASATTAGTFGAATAYSTGGIYPNLVALGDVNADGHLDVLTANIGSNTVAVLLGAAKAGALLGATTYASGGDEPVGVALSDVNADGRLDLVVGNLGTTATGGLVGILLASATTTGTFGAVTTYPTGGSDTTGILVQDVNSDGRPDLVTANSGSANVSILLGLATAGTFGPATLYASGSTSPNFALLSDITNDGRPDLVISNQDGNNVSVLPGLAVAGTFGPATNYPTGGVGPVGLAVGDVNNDQRPDVVATNYSSATVAVLTNSFPLATVPALAAEVSLFPNPARGAFTVRLPAVPGGAAVQAELLDALGRVAYQQHPVLPAGATAFEVEAVGLAPGVYTLRVQAGSSVLARRVVLE